MPSKRYLYREVAQAYCGCGTIGTSVRMFTLWLRRDSILLRRLARAGYRPRQRLLTAKQMWLIKQRWGMPEDAPQGDFCWQKTANARHRALAALAAMASPTA